MSVGRLGLLIWVWALVLFWITLISVSTFHVFGKEIVVNRITTDGASVYGKIIIPSFLSTTYFTSIDEKDILLRQAHLIDGAGPGNKAHLAINGLRSSLDFITPRIQLTSNSIKTVASGIDGYFVLTDVPLGSHLLAVEFGDLRCASYRIDVSRGIDNSYIVRLYQVQGSNEIRVDDGLGLNPTSPFYLQCYRSDPFFKDRQKIHWFGLLKSPLVFFPLSVLLVLGLEKLVPK